MKAKEFPRKAVQFLLFWALGFCFLLVIFYIRNAAFPLLESASSLWAEALALSFLLVCVLMTLKEMVVTKEWDLALLFTSILGSQFFLLSHPLISDFAELRHEEALGTIVFIGAYTVMGCLAKFGVEIYSFFRKESLKLVNKDFSLYWLLVISWATWLSLTLQSVWVQQRVSLFDNLVLLHVIFLSWVMGLLMISLVAWLKKVCVFAFRPQAPAKKSSK